MVYFLTCEDLEGIEQSLCRVTSIDWLYAVCYICIIIMVGSYVMF